jgi:hypothetical protein
MAFQQSDIDALKAAIATGALSVRYADGRQVTYRGLSEMRQTLQILQDEVSPPPTGSSRSSVAGF